MRTRIMLAALAIACSACSAETVTPAEFVSAHSQDATAVVNTVQTVDVAMADAGSGNTDMVTLSGVLANAQGMFDRVNKVLLDASHPKGFEDSETEMWSATAEMVSAMKSGRAWIDDGKPSELVDYRNTGIRVKGGGIRLWCRSGRQQAAHHRPSPVPRQLHRSPSSFD